jgi:hypothetical protein
MKRALAALGAVLVMGTMLWIGVRPHSGMGQPVPAAPGSPGPAGPRYDFAGASDRIDALLADAGRGDVAAYLSSFTGPLRDRLGRQADERGRAAFSDELRRTAKARKSHAVFSTEPDGYGADAARITVESTFADRIERQTYRLVREGKAWLINDVESARHLLPANPLGSLATYQEPEGVPVPVERQQDSSVQEP